MHIKGHNPPLCLVLAQRLPHDVSPCSSSKCPTSCQTWLQGCHTCEPSPSEECGQAAATSTTLYMQEHAPPLRQVLARRLPQAHPAAAHPTRALRRPCRRWPPLAAHNPLPAGVCRCAARSVQQCLSSKGKTATTSSHVSMREQGLQHQAPGGHLRRCTAASKHAISTKPTCAHPVQRWCAVACKCAVVCSPAAAHSPSSLRCGQLTSGVASGVTGVCLQIL